MTLQEAIIHAKEKSKSLSGKCAQEHLQLAEWLEELQSLRKTSRWVPVSERLPNNYQQVLAQWEKPNHILNETHIFYDIMCIDSMGEWNNGCGIPNGKVVAWMPLPESYKEDETK